MQRLKNAPPVLEQANIVGPIIESIVAQVLQVLGPQYCGHVLGQDIYGFRWPRSLEPICGTLCILIWIFSNCTCLV